MNNLKEDRADYTKESCPEQRLWVKPAMERLSLKDALNTHRGPVTLDGSIGYS